MVTLFPLPPSSLKPAPVMVICVPPATPPMLQEQETRSMSERSERNARQLSHLGLMPDMVTASPPCTMQATSKHRSKYNILDLERRSRSSSCYTVIDREHAISFLPRSKLSETVRPRSKKAFA
jgi:hypothetical protein